MCTTKAVFFFVFVAEVIHFWFLSGSDIRDSIREQLVQKLQMQQVNVN